MKTRSELRDVIVKVMYQTYILEKAKIKYDIKDLIKEVLEIENEYVNNCINGIIEHNDEIISLANKYLVNWEIDRLSKLDKAILSLAIYELMYTDTPEIVVINESIELSHKYSDENVTKMINAALDSLYHSKDYNG